MLVRLLYASRAAVPLTAEVLDAILDTSLARNPPNGITGVLCHSNSVFLQALEGSREAVSRLYLNIGRDARHKEVVLLHYEEIAERAFSGWSMGRVNANKINAAMLLKYSAQGELDPYRMPGAASLALMKELIAGAAIVGRSPERARH
ncbi:MULTISPECIES: BLUF domain-containing protein [unclassified Cupriavidus]|uniref:BLUF domain-containing protein n=1 Tax=unclassified Cupriavidus TaxID=2640874 RepID=UPI0010F4AA62|nr:MULTISPECIES: BLUF domain-containing protein [unclassified Cupriavidus]MWL90263.1 blue light sensor protein [Cupriavidus sp. SW-Y-13]